MSVEQGVSFAQGLKKILDDFKADCQTTTDEYKAFLASLAPEFQEKSHTYAKEMTQKAADMTKDIQELYQEIYPEDAEGGEGGGENPPPEGGGGDWEGKPSDPHPSTGPVGPQPKGSKK